MKLVILAGGQGTRLYPLTYDIKKEMLPLNGKPTLQYNIEWAKKNDIKEIIICTGHLHEQIEEYFGDGSKFGVNIKYSIEKEPLGTGGPLRFAKELIGDEDFFVLNGDILCNIDLNKAKEFHKKNNSLATILIHKSNHPMDSDLVETDEKGKVKNIWTKPHQRIPPTTTSNSGAYIINSKILDHIPLEKISLEREILPRLHEEGHNIYGYDTNEYLRDMGTHNRLKEIEEIIKNNNGEVPKYLYDQEQ